MTERQKYDVVKRIGNAELRQYHPCVMADVTVNADYRFAANLGFRPLVTYISRSNIAMTAPVVQEQRDTRSWVVSFVMPDGMHLADLPTPENADVRLRPVPTQSAAALAFSGIATEDKLREKEAELRAILQREQLAATGPLRLARFDPPWKPGFMRHNEVIIPV